jgi:hypothetical protein
MACLAIGFAGGGAVAVEPAAFFKANCVDCHDADTRKGNLDLTALKADFSNVDLFPRWVKVYDRIESGQMPPKKKPRPPAGDVQAVTHWLHDSLIAAERARLDPQGRTAIRRLTRGEYENTVRDLLSIPGISLQAGLPDDGNVHGFDKNADALDISHVNMAKYIEAADSALDMAIATAPAPPTVLHERYSLASDYATRIILINGDAVLLKNKQPDPNFPPADDHTSRNLGELEKAGKFSVESSVGVFRHEDESFNPTFAHFATLYPGRYRLRASFFSFQWDKGTVLPSRGVEAARLSAVQLRENGRGTADGSRVLGYYDSPSLNSQVHEFETWLNYKETIGFNTASLAPVVNYTRKGKSMAFTGPGIASDWLEIEGPIHDIWPPQSHRVLFGDLPLTAFKPADHKDIHPPRRHVLKQEIIHAKNKPDPATGIWTVQSNEPTIDADRLLGAFLPKAFRRPVSVQIRKEYVDQVRERLAAGDTFETAMRWAYRAAMCSPDFLFHVEPGDALDDYGLACRVSYFLWNSMPDDALVQLAASHKLNDPAALAAQVDRMLGDPRSQRFVEDFVGQWLRLRHLAENDPDRKLYPEFSPYLQDSMRAETLAYFRELIDKDLDASHLVRSDFAMINEKLAKHYGIAGVSGPTIRRVALPPNCPRGAFITQAAILKITANGTTTSPVVRGAFVMGRILGQPPEPPPPNIPAIEPDVQGAKTIREQLDKHRSDPTCASCHSKIDPPGFALEAFDVIGGQRDRYRSIGGGDPAPRGAIDPFIGISFKLGPNVDASGMMPDGRKFGGIEEFQSLLAADTHLLLKNLTEQLAIYATGREIAFGDRDDIAAIVSAAEKHGGGVRTLLHALVQSRFFQTK